MSISLTRGVNQTDFFMYLSCGHFSFIESYVYFVTRTSSIGRAIEPNYPIFDRNGRAQPPCNLNWNYRNNPEYWVRQARANSLELDQIGVYTVCYLSRTSTFSINTH